MSMLVGADRGGLSLYVIACACYPQGPYSNYFAILDDILITYGLSLYGLV
jgi:hypothetical protein